MSTVNSIFVKIVQTVNPKVKDVPSSIMSYTDESEWSVKIQVETLFSSTTAEIVKPTIEV